MQGAEPIINGLMQRGIPRHIAIGIAANMAVESDGFKSDVNEYAPLVPGSRGGYGLNQWTGPRRVQFEQFAQSRGVDPSDVDAQLDFTLWELGNTEKRAGQALMAAQTPEDATRIYSEKFLRPGIPHLDRRLGVASQLSGNALARPQNSAPQPQNSPAQHPNALAGMVAPEKKRNALTLAYNGLDPAMFQTRGYS